MALPAADRDQILNALSRVLAEHLARPVLPGEVTHGRKEKKERKRGREWRKEKRKEKGERKGKGVEREGVGSHCH
jgi:hypothetical protein